jgi:hypothetical protein
MPVTRDGMVSSGVLPHDPDTETPSRVYVNGVRIPVGDIDLYMRKEGDLDFTRYLEGEFASPFDGVPYTDVFNSLTPTEQSEPDTIRVDVQDRLSGEYTVGFQGIITGVGNSPTAGESWWSFRAQGIGHRLSNVPASKSFSGDGASVRDVLTYVTETLDDHLSFNVKLGNAPDQPVEDTTSEDSDGSDEEVSAAEGYPGHYNPDSGGSTESDPTGVIRPNESERSFSYTVSTEKAFQYGKHTLADIVNWIGQKTNLYLWFVPTRDGASLIAVREPALKTHTAHYLDSGDTEVVNNDALSELRPVNTLVVKAPAKESVKESNTFQSNERGKALVVAKARHSTLYERSGRTELYAETHRISDAMNKAEVENEARKRLKNAIDETTAGDMQTMLRGSATPYDLIEALPTCQGKTDRDLEPLTYETARIHHEITADDIPETKWNVGVHTDSVEDIEIIDSWKPEGI